MRPYAEMDDGGDGPPEKQASPDRAVSEKASEHNEKAWEKLRRELAEEHAKIDSAMREIHTYAGYGVLHGRDSSRVSALGSIDNFGFLERPNSSTSSVAYSRSDHWTAQIGLSVGFTAIGVSGASFVGIALDNKGNIAFYWGGGGGLGIGFGASGGVSGQFSDAQSINDLKGEFKNASFGGGAGIGVTGDSFWGMSDHGPVIGGGFTAGLGLGETSFLGITDTAVIPIYEP